MSFSQPTRTYADLLSYTKAICSMEFSAADIVRINNFFNQAARKIYNRYMYWTRYLVIGEPRSVVRGYVGQTEDSYYVWGAGSDIANGLYVRNGSDNGKPRYDKEDEDGTSISKISYSPTDSAYLIYDLTKSPSSAMYSNTETDFISEDGWVTEPEGIDPPPIARKLSAIGQFLQINSGAVEPFKNRISRNIDFIVTSDGARIVNGCSQNIVYVTYKKQLTETFGDGTGGTTSNIPEEFFDYMALYASRIWQLSKVVGSDPDTRVITLREIEDVVQDQLMIQERNTPSFVQTLIQTGITQDRTLI